MGMLQKNDASVLIAEGNHQTLSIDGTSKVVDSNVTLNKDAQFVQIQLLSNSAKFHLSGEDATTGNPFEVPADWTAVWSTAQLAKSAWTQNSGAATLVIQSMRG
jgi:hypothetical protein